MTRNRSRRCREWRTLLLSSCLAMAPYIAFDVLDLDGSEVCGCLSSDVIASEPSQAGTERSSLQHLHSTPQAPRSLKLGLQSTAEFHQPPPAHLC